MTGAVSLDVDALKTAIGREQRAGDIVTARLIDSLKATFDQAKFFPARAGHVPITLHWCLAPPIVPMSQLGMDGHPSRGEFLPAVPLPNRMWAGGMLNILDELREGDRVERVSRIADVTVKQGKTGELCFVAVDHAILTARGLAIRERQDIVYREREQRTFTLPPAGRAPVVPDGAEHSLAIDGHPTLLFRYSALTFNGHRIHYDRKYCIEDERYPGLVVHGPLQAALLAEFAADLKGGKAPKRFSFRSVRPLFDRAPFTLNAARGETGLTLWTADAVGETTMTAEAQW